MSQTDEKTYGRLVTIDEAAQWLSVSAWTIRQWIQQGKMESHKLFGRRRIYEDEIVRLIEESREPARTRQAA